MVKCDDCEKEATHIGEPNPYAEEIHNNLTPCNLCDDCYHESCMDI